MSSQYPSRHAFFVTKNSEGTSNVEKTEKQKTTLRTCPEVATRRAVGGGGCSNNSYSLSTDKTPPRTPSPDELGDNEAALRSPSSALHPSSVDDESELTSSQWRLQRRALPRGNDPFEMFHRPILSNATQPDWHALATEGAAKNLAVVILQGDLEAQEIASLKTCLQLMGFDDPNILHQPYGKISKEEIESRAASLVNDLAPRSNLLLMICEKDYGYIELDPNFLDEQIYSHVAKYKKRKDQKFMDSVAESNIGQFDPRKFEGVTLHVIIDGVKAHPLKHILRLDLAKHEDDVLRSNWKHDNAHQESNRSILEGPMGHGAVVQFWVSRDMHGYSPLLLLKAMLCICLEEPELSYQILLLRLRTILHKTLEASLSQNPFYQGNPTNGLRCRSGIAVHTCSFLIKKLACYFSERALENQKKKVERDIYDGNYVLSSVDKFDPHLSLKLDWKY